MKPFPLAATLFLGSVTLGVADAPGADWMTKEQVTQKLQAMGYTDMRKLEAEGGTGKARHQVWRILRDPRRPSHWRADEE